jgi:hypothetical protein
VPAGTSARVRTTETLPPAVIGSRGDGRHGQPGDGLDVAAEPPDVHLVPPPQLVDDAAIEQADRPHRPRRGIGAGRGQRHAAARIHHHGDPRRQHDLMLGDPLDVAHRDHHARQRGQAQRREQRRGRRPQVHRVATVDPDRHGGDRQHGDHERRHVPPLVARRQQSALDAMPDVGGGEEDERGHAALDGSDGQAARRGSAVEW